MRPQAVAALTLPAVSFSLSDGPDRPCAVYEDLTSAISVGFIAWLDLGLAVSLRHDVLVVLAAGVLHQLRVQLEYEGIVNVHGRT